MFYAGENALKITLNTEKGKKNIDRNVYWNVPFVCIVDPFSVITTHWNVLMSGAKYAARTVIASHVLKHSYTQIYIFSMRNRWVNRAIQSIVFQNKYGWYIDVFPLSHTRIHLFIYIQHTTFNLDIVLIFTYEEMKFTDKYGIKTAVKRKMWAYNMWNVISLKVWKAKAFSFIVNGVVQLDRIMVFILLMLSCLCPILLHSTGILLHTVESYSYKHSHTHKVYKLIYCFIISFYGTEFMVALWF